jgi:type I restriction enzyme, S subunit
MSRIPTLRFAEFSEVWNVLPLSQLTPQNKKFGIVDGPFGSNLKTIHYRSEGIPIITSGYVTDGIFKADKYLYVTEEKFNKEIRSAVYPEDIVMAKIGARCGSSAILPSDHSISILSGNALKITIDSKYHSNMYVWQQLWRLYLNHEIDKLRATGAQPALSIKNLKKFKIGVPSLPEQQKIADFLSLVDKKIQLLLRKKKLLEQYKKGVMQKLFSQEIRFKDKNGNEYPDWEEKKIGDILTFYPTNSLSRNDLNTSNGLVQNIHYGDIHTKYKAMYDSEKQPPPFINDDLFFRTRDSDHYCKVGDLVIADASEDYADIGKAIEIINMGDNKIVSGLHTILGRDNNDQTVVGFKGYLFQSYNLSLQLKRLSQGVSVLGITKTNLSKINVSVPSNEEQAKICEFLMAVDRKIESISNQIELTQIFKKGLLQQMFI